MSAHYDLELAEADAKLQKMYEELEALQIRMAKQKRIVAALRELADMTDEGRELVSGITDAVRTVFQSAEAPLLPVEVKKRVEALGIKQDSLLASVHTIIRRLLKANEIREVPPKGSGPIAYAWVRNALLHGLRKRD